MAARTRSEPHALVVTFSRDGEEPDTLFAKDGQHRIVLRVARVVAHAGDRFIKLESLYRYVRKFHAMRERRYVLVPLTHLPTALVVLLRLEFGRHRSPASDEQTA